MKNMKNLLGLLLMAAIIGFTSCSEDDDDEPIPPSLKVDVIPGTIVDTNSFVAFIWEARDGDAKLETFTIKEGNSIATDMENTTWSSVEVDDNENYRDTALFLTASTEKTVKYTFTVTDKDGESTSKEITITTESQTTPIDIYNDKTLVSAYLAATTGSQFMDATTGTTYRHDASGSENATFGFISGGGSGAVIMASGTTLSFTQKPTGWSNGTKLATTTLSSSDFDAISDETALLNAMPASISSDEIKNLQDGAANENVNVIAFDDNGTKGLIKLPTSLNNDQDQSITIDVKVQQ